MITAAKNTPWLILVMPILMGCVRPHETPIITPQKQYQVTGTVIIVHTPTIKDTRVVTSTQSIPTKTNTATHFSEPTSTQTIPTKIVPTDTKTQRPSSTPETTYHETTELELPSLIEYPCEDDQATVSTSGLNVRVGPGAGRQGEPTYQIVSYLLQGECVRVNATNSNLSWVMISDSPRTAAKGGWVAVDFLDFGLDHPELSDISVVTPQPLSTHVTSPDSETSQPLGIEYLSGANYSCYTIQGKDEYQLANQIDKLGPYEGDKRAVALASYRFGISGGMCYEDGTSDLSTVNVSLTHTITVPCWYPPEGMNPQTIVNFDNFMASVARHELTHIEIARKHADILESRIRDSGTCSQPEVQILIDQVLSEDQRAQLDFHASSEGQPIPFP